MTFLEAMILATSSGVLTMGFGVAKWAMHVETRLAVIEARLKIREA